MILLDTNVLLRFTDAANPDCATARHAVKKLRHQGEMLVVVPQNLYEYWAVATRPTGNVPNSNGLGMTTIQADQWLGYWLRNYPLLPDDLKLSGVWRTLVRDFNVSGRKSHDARLAAAMETHNLSKLLTFNAQDFRRFAHLTILDPHAV